MLRRKIRRLLQGVFQLASDQVSSTDPLFKAGQTAFENLLKAFTNPFTVSGTDLATQMQAYGAASARIAELQADLYGKHLALWQSMLGQSQESTAAKPAPVAEPERGDRRFSGPEWGASPYFDYIRQSYLINSRFLNDWVDALQLEPQAKERVRFATRQFIDAMSPANFAATNPEALKLALETQGESLTRGIRNLADDVSKGRISMTDESVFEVGKNLAVTPGAVVFENELIQLIQYAPLTDKVYSRPLLMVPPCINKFYIMDLQQENSLVRHAVEQGHTVFMVSWRNIGAEQSKLTWDDYLRLGIFDAIEAALEVAGTPDLNVLGFCVGGTLVGSALAIMAAREDKRVASLTLLAAMLDFSEVGEIAIFIDEKAVAAREAAIGSGGIMPGRDLALAFSSLRANDLIWPYVVNNYLKGRSPAAFDLLYWNADATNLPGPMYCHYLRNTYLENNLRVPGRMTMLGEKVDLGRVKVPAYVLATKEDHIVPWKTAYESVNLLGGDKRFVLGASGHIAGVINPASKNRRSYWVNESVPARAGDWLEAAKEQPGSWWNDWSEWLSRFGGPRREARARLGGTKHEVIEPAPGRFVKQRIV
jgi:polyhydroxyalkanoate synthase